jgi:type I restriction enzyme M protein
VIKKIHKKGATLDPLRGLFSATIEGKPAVVEYEPDPNLRDTEQVPLLEEGGIEASCVARCCLTPPMPGTCRRA